MKTLSMKKNAILILVTVALIFGVRLALAALIAKHDQVTLAAIDNEITKEHAVLVTIADLARQNGTDAETEKIVKDCKSDERRKFDSLLDSLSKTISPTELAELESLFYKCGNFYAERKAIMAARLDREVTMYTDLRELREHIQTYNTDITAEMDAWKNTAEAELKWSGYFNDLVVHQGTIISLLRSGKSASSAEVVAVLAQVKSAREQMEVLNSQIQSYRETTHK